MQALLVSAKPLLNITGGSVYIRTGVWRLVHDFIDSECEVMHSPATSEPEWKKLGKDELLIGPAYARAIISKAGTEKYVSIYLIPVTENAN